MPSKKKVQVKKKAPVKSKKTRILSHKLAPSGSKKPVKKKAVSSVAIQKAPTKTIVKKKEEKQQKEHEKKWESLYNKAKDIRPQPFRLSNTFSAKTPLKHSVFGWGWIVSNKNHRLHVMFKDKTRVLLSNQNLDGTKISSFNKGPKE